MLKGWTAVIDTSKLGGWVRAIVAAGLGVAIGRWPLLAQWLSPDAQQQIGIAAAAIIVGFWSHVAKKIDG